MHALPPSVLQYVELCSFADFKYLNSSQHFNAHIPYGVQVFKSSGRATGIGQQPMPALVKSSFTEVFLVVLKCTDATNPFEKSLGKRALALLF